jgi:phosphomannomutase
MSQRILSISGLRGIIGDGLDPVYVTQFAAAVGTLAKGGKVVVSRDGRSTGTMMKHAVISGLMSTGCHVLDADIATTPTCGVLITHHQAAGGIQITASHNPVEWNGLKPFTPQGSVYDAATGEKLLELLNSQKFAFQPWSSIGTVEKLTDICGPHFERVKKLVDVEAIKKRHFKVVIDCSHGSGALAGPQILEQLGCEVIVLGGTPDGKFTHKPEPLAENLTELSAQVIKHGADVGFAQDPDADRLAIVDEHGHYIGEELTLALAVDYVLERTPGPVVVNGSTSRVSADLAQKYHVPFHRSAVGEANVTQKMREVKAIIGGEGNGGVIEPHVGYVRDSLVSMAYVLGGLTSQKIPLSKWVAKLPAYAIIKDKMICPKELVEPACQLLLKAFPDAKSTSGDGLRLDWEDRWVQLRASNTEPIIRVISEAPNSQIARLLCDQTLEMLKQVTR